MSFPALELAEQAAWLAYEPQGFSCLHHPSTGIQSPFSPHSTRKPTQVLIVCVTSIFWTKPSSQAINTFGIEAWNSGNRSVWEMHVSFVGVINTEVNEGWIFRALSSWSLHVILSWLCMVGSKMADRADKAHLMLGFPLLLHLFHLGTSIPFSCCPHWQSSLLAHVRYI